LHKPTGQARVVLDGRTYYLGKYGTDESRQRYQQLIARWAASHHTVAAAPQRYPNLTVAELLLAYLRFAEGYYVKTQLPPHGTI
jgi:hypothetical protein